MGDPDRLLRRVQPFELSFVMHQDFLEAARVEPANRPRAPIADRREVPSVAEVAAELRLAALRLSPRVGEPPIPEPLLAAELGPRRILRRSERAESLPEVVDLPLWTEAVSLGPFDEFGLLGGADLGGRGERLLGRGDLRDGGLLRLLRRLGVRLRLLLLGHVTPPRPSS